MHSHAITLIKNGKAYVCDQTSQEIKDSWYLTNPGIESPFRGRSIEENLDLFGRMKIGEFGDGARPKSKNRYVFSNLNMRDPVIYEFFMHPIIGLKTDGAYIQCMTGLMDLKIQ